MVGGFGRNYWFALFVVGVCNHCCEGTYLASPTPFEEEACQILTAAASATSWHLCKAYPESSATVVLASRLTSPTSFYNGVCGMAMPLQAVGSSKWSQQKLLHQLWGTLHGSEVVVVLPARDDGKNGKRRVPRNRRTPSICNLSEQEVLRVRLQLLG